MRIEFELEKVNPEWTDAMFANAKPAPEMLPDLVAYSEKRNRGQRGPQKKPRKVAVLLRVDAGALAVYRAGGRGYQTRMAAVLAEHAK
jgi:uncharacterized protein (DUF4415 family)